MVIFHSYVSLPEGSFDLILHFRVTPWEHNDVRSSGLRPWGCFLFWHCLKLRWWPHCLHAPSLFWDIFWVDDLYLSMTPIAETSSALSVLAMSATLDDSSGSILFRASWERCWTENLHTSSTAQGGGGSFKNRKPIGEVGCCESGMAKRIHWWIERCLISLTLSLSFSAYLPTYLLTYLPTYLSSIYLSIDLSISLFFI